MGRRFQFGICTDQNMTWEKTVQRWQQFEQLGFESAWLCDHLIQPSRPEGPYFEAWTLLAALAARTQWIRIGVLVTSNTFRYPSVLAKEVVTVDHISNGRLDFGFGAGWYEPEHRMFGFRFPENFRWPYAAEDVQEFWRRWHMSLSTWFRDYLYVPLGGSRVSPARTYVNLVIVFFLCGLWHGASWTFVIWGLYHGTFLVMERLGLADRLMRLWRPLRHLYLLIVVMVGWVLFRADTLTFNGLSGP